LKLHPARAHLCLLHAPCLLPRGDLGGRRQPGSRAVDHRLQAAKGLKRLPAGVGRHKNKRMETGGRLGYGKSRPAVGWLQP
jgi:hypothetical protein